jgi:hypothetical protein
VVASPGLLSLQAAIAANSLAPSQQAALLTVLGYVIPIFRGPDERSAVPVDQTDLVEETWAAVLYTLDSEGAVPVPPPPIGHGAVQVVRFLLGTATGQSGTALPDQAIVLRASLDVTTPYTGGTTITIGHAAATTAYQLAADNDPTTPGLYEVDQDTTVTPATRVLATVIGGPVAGAAEVIVEYVEVPNP